MIRERINPEEAGWEIKITVKTGFSKAIFKPAGR